LRYREKSTMPPADAQTAAQVHQDIGGESSRLLLQHLQMLLAELSHLGGDHGLTIRLILIVCEVFLMIIFSHVEFIELGHFGHNGLVPKYAGCSVLDCFIGDLLLSSSWIEDGGTILRANIRALAISVVGSWMAKNTLSTSRYENNSGIERICVASA